MSVNIKWEVMRDFDNPQILNFGVFSMVLEVFILESFGKNIRYHGHKNTHYVLLKSWVSRILWRHSCHIKYKQ